MISIDSIVLAGGKSRRFGKPKFMVKLIDKPLILHVIEKLYAISSRIIVSVKSDNQKNAIENILADSQFIDRITFTTDDARFLGILSGVKAALLRCDKNLVFITGCDLPFISPKIVLWLANNINHYDAIVPLWKNGFIEPLYSIYRVTPTLHAIEKTIENNDLSLRGVLSQISVKYVSAEYLEKLANMPIFFNINSKKDLIEAKKIFYQMSKHCQSYHEVAV